MLEPSAHVSGQNIPSHTSGGGKGPEYLLSLLLSFLYRKSLTFQYSSYKWMTFQAITHSITILSTPQMGCVESCGEKRKRKREGGRGSEGRRLGGREGGRKHMAKTSQFATKETSTTHLASKKQTTQCVRYHFFQGCSLIPELEFFTGVPLAQNLSEELRLLVLIIGLSILG